MTVPSVRMYALFEESHLRQIVGYRDVVEERSSDAISDVDIDVEAM